MHTLLRRGTLEVDDLGASLRDYEVIDIRPRSEWEQGHIPGSSHVPFDVLEDAWSPTDLRLPFAVLAACDDDADRAADMLVARGFDAVAVRGGAPAWRASGQCMVTNRR